MVHAQGKKPWEESGRDSLVADLSPYISACRPLAGEIPGGEALADRPKLPLGRFYDRLFFGHPSLRALPTVVLSDVKTTLAIRTRVRRAMDRVRARPSVVAHPAGATARQTDTSAR